MIYTALSYVADSSKHIQAKFYSNLPSTIELLSKGGDDRISIDDNTHINKYGCTPYPNQNLVSFSSSTASVISEAAFAAADELRETISLALKVELPLAVYSHELNRIKNELLSLCALDDVPNLEVIFGASGTDLHLIASQLATSSNGKPLLAVMPDVNETGSGVTAALTSRHFGSVSALGQNVTKGLPVKYTNPVDVVSVSMRFSDNKFRPEETIDAEVEALVDKAAGQGQSVLLILVDTSKTGLISPSPSCAIKLKRRYPSLVKVLVDACQFRISSDTLRAYLELDCMVMVTGSKFLTGPVFCGALLVPDSAAKELLSKPSPFGLSMYSSRADWPENCMASQSLKNIENFGLLLRWQAALEELKQFRALPNIQIRYFTARFANAIQDRLKLDEYFSQVLIRPLVRNLIIKDNSWDEVPTIFTFVLLKNDKNGLKIPLTNQETQQIYQWLKMSPSDSNRPDTKVINANVEIMQCLIGQPVIIGSSSEQPTTALRLSLSSRLIVEGSNNGESANFVIQTALSTLDNISLLVQMLPKSY